MEGKFVQGYVKKETYMWLQGIKIKTGKPLQDIVVDIIEKAKKSEENDQTEDSLRA